VTSATSTTRRTSPLTPRAQRLEELFDAALDLTPEKRAGFVDDACGLDATLRRELQAMLTADAAAETDASTEAIAREPGAIGRFEVLGRIGEGGMGVVYLGHDARLDRKVAIKLLRGAVSRGALLRLEREAQAMAKVTHPNVVPIYEVVDVDELGVAVVMEYIEGSTASQWLRAEQRTWREVVALFLEASRGLEAAHAAGMVHRDFKADNVLVGRDGRVRVVDFGLARSASVGRAPDGEIGAVTLLDVGLTQQGALLGTPTHMSPEQFRGETVGPATDQFALAVALYRGVYGCLPFPGDDLPTIRASVLRGELGPPPSDRVPPALTAAIVRGLAHAPGDRWPSIEAFAKELERVVGVSPEDDLSRAAHVRRLVMLAVLPCGLLSSLLASAATAESGLTRAELVLHALGAALILGAITLGLRKRLLITAIDRRLALIINAFFWAFTFHRLLLVPLGQSVTELFVSEGIMLGLACFAGALAIARWLGWVTLLSALYACIATLWPVSAGHGFNALLTMTTMVAVYFWGRDRVEPVRPPLA